MNETVIRQQYDHMANFYDQRWHTYITKTLCALKNWAEIAPTATVLDIGCGTGEFEQLLLTENPQQVITGVDISEKMLFVAQQKFCTYPHVSFQNASVSNLPFTNKSFDVIVSASAFHYFDDPRGALMEIRRVLKPEGKVFILDWCKDYLWCQVCDFILKFVDPAYKGCYTQKEFHNLLRCAQFDIDSATKFHFNFVWGMMMAKATPQIEHNSLTT
ncbi:class I SAM-dependent methyltransferase [Umezakia ovalisporum]|jgi:ubiquinone/menaquinone biosynthesis C-methylase UbiE|uniref:Class I SAM-dependent methyltransferase n=1 Tax=Umezakia ovalisporum FSS-62 TaxID=2971776 RepID=A0AA43H0T7_9CYAN|nr:class I SAM-dependent methyltransferase [Umezakia ovalisporum]MBI1240484.1 methyltransferase domain-containing protein [Nostoc sp. RI_552]MDH6065374.1 class I SAM-dependent methyltransferase [Umezakia ovalisporum FSS-62]MDH6066197.1 class I SAM-dependent methyltransferase [Umezakia ovalisporum APH033B]MDH6078948.1 class I SAM-dependent methyltransferase [Umezakia ovalisporum FSS-45]MDH6086422.1 class I SAM-dependent methyltransferase [Umezakia ovalisporum TAC611]